MEGFAAVFFAEVECEDVSQRVLDQGAEGFPSVSHGLVVHEGVHEGDCYTG